jgi:WD40 repeat protein
LVPQKAIGSITANRKVIAMDAEKEMNLEETGMIENALVEEDVDETPEFINPDDAVEVQVDDDVPMEDDGEEEIGDMDFAEKEPVVDMSVTQLDSHQGPVYAVASFLDETNDTSTLTIISGGGDDKAFLHKMNTGSTPTAVPLEYAHSDSVSCVALNLAYVSTDLSKTPRLAAVGAYDGAIVIYDPDTGAKLQNLEGPTDVEWICFHPKGGAVLLAGSAADNTVWMFHVPMNKCLQVFVGHEAAVTAGAFSPDGKWALSASTDGTVRVWAPRTGQSKHVFRLGDDTGGAGLTCLATNGGSDGQLIIVGAEDGQAHVCHIGTKKVVASLRHYEIPTTTVAPAMDDDEDEMELPMSVEAVGFAAPSVNPNWCATGGVDGQLKIWDLSNGGQCRQVCRLASLERPAAEDGTHAISSTAGITRLQWHATQPWVFISTTEGSVHVWDARDGKLLRSLTGHTDVVNDLHVTFSDQGRNAVIVSGSDDQSVRLFEVDSASVLQN